MTATVPALRTPSPADRARVRELLGREPQGAYEIVVRRDDGDPVVLRNDPILDDGTPMPTRYWLVGEREHLAVSRLESTGGVRRAEAELDPDTVADAHHRYAAERDEWVPAGHTGPRPSGGVAGTRTGVKCLHAHYAWFLAGGDDPVGRWVADQLGDTTGTTGTTGSTGTTDLANGSDT
ncbi:MAG: DUF501 domain-containing protein [Actinomycetes bacterium]